jgi:Domain of unknown function (DUF1844)
MILRANSNRKFLWYGASFKLSGPSLLLPMDETNSSVPSTPPTVFDHVAVIVQQMAQVAWQKMGLQTDSITGKLEVNLAEAKVAIDVVVKLGAILEPELDDSDRRQLQGLIRDLRINFVQKNTGSSI